MDLYNEMEPLYKELHAYVRRKLFVIYGEVSLLFPQNVFVSIFGQIRPNLEFNDK